jgi:hypothetical protein
MWDRHPAQDSVALLLLCDVYIALGVGPPCNAR